MSPVLEPRRPGHVHRIPVDVSFNGDALAAFAELCNFGRRVTNTGDQVWVTVHGCDGVMCLNIEMET